MKNFNCEFYVVKSAKAEIKAVSEGPAIEKFKVQLVERYGFTEDELENGQLSVRFAGDDAIPMSDDS